MELDFKNEDLRQLCMQQSMAQRRLGKDSARKLRARLMDIIVAEVVTDLIAGKPHPLKGNRAGQFALSLAGGHRLVFEPNQSPIPYQKDGSLDWSKVSKIRIVLIGDYHD